MTLQAVSYHYGQSSGVLGNKCLPKFTTKSWIQYQVALPQNLCRIFTATLSYILFSSLHTSDSIEVAILILCFTLQVNQVVQITMNPKNPEKLAVQGLILVSREMMMIMKAKMIRMNLPPNDDEERNEESDDGNGSKQSYPGATNGGRSRRKPAAPQWVNPEWSGDTEQDVEMKQDEPEDDRTINGVCVVNSGLAGHLASLSSPSYTINNSH